MTEKRQLRDKLNEMTRPQLMTVLQWIVAISIVLVLGAFAAYFLHFGPSGISNDPQIWAQFGAYVGGVATPFVSLFALIALVLTIVLQSRQLDLSAKELQATRDELKRSSDAQELAARLNALSTLFSEYNHRLEESDLAINRAQGQQPVQNTRMFENMNREREKLMTSRNRILDELEGLAF